MKFYNSRFLCPEALMEEIKQSFQFYFEYIYRTEEYSLAVFSPQLGSATTSFD
jgi:hypothetical protein